MLSDAEGQYDLVIGVEPSPSSRGAQFVAGNQVSLDAAGQRSGTDGDPSPPNLCLEATAANDGRQGDAPDGGADGPKGFDCRSRRENHKGDAPNGEDQAHQPSHQPNKPFKRHTLEVLGDFNVVVGQGTSQVNRHDFRLTHHNRPVRSAWQHGIKS